MVMLVVLEIFEFVIVSISLINFSTTKQPKNGKNMLGFKINLNEAKAQYTVI
jgi:hypothetical protein